MSRYEPRPRYPLVAGRIERGYGPLVAEIGQRNASVVALDGPATLDWDRVGARLARWVGRAGRKVRLIHMQRFLADRAEIERRTLDGPLHDDPVFAKLYAGSLGELFERVPPVRGAPGETTLVLGPGSGLVDPDLLWVADHPKRVAAAAVKRGDAAPIGLAACDPDAARRLVFIDWPMLDRHRQAQLPHLDRFVDLTDPTCPVSVDGSTLRASLGGLAEGPFRTVPIFAPGPWGGQWLRRRLGIETDAPNLAWSYELIGPESSVLLGDEPAIEVGFEVVLAAAGRRILGGEVEARFAGSFPIRFDYLDTMDGGHLSVHCHPLEAYMRDVFGWDYPQHESYYVMASRPGARIFLGLRDAVDLDAFAADARRSQAEGTGLEIERFVQAHPARPHRLYLIPAGTPHASSEGNVVLEISATPYLYSLRFYDWLREDLDGSFRPVQLTHAFANLDTERVGARVRDELLPSPRAVRHGERFSEHELGRHPELFFAVHRLDFEGEVADETGGRFHILNLVHGDELIIETDAGPPHHLAYAETILIPAAVGRYRLRGPAGRPSRVVKAFVA